MLRCCIMGPEGLRTCPEMFWNVSCEGHAV